MKHLTWKDYLRIARRFKRQGATKEQIHCLLMGMEMSNRMLLVRNWEG